MFNFLINFFLKEMSLLYEDEDTNLSLSKEEIRLRIKFNLNDENSSLLLKSIEDSTIFDVLAQCNKEIITSYMINSQNLNIRTFFIRNIFDVDDEELLYLCFQSKFEDNVNTSVFNNEDMETVIMNGLVAIDVVHFKEFKIKYEHGDFYFSFSYNRDSYPRYQVTRIGKLFMKIFLNFRDNIKLLN